MKKRHLETHLLRDARYYPVLTLTGPRQSGKTTLARATFASHSYVSLETIDQRRFAREDPRGFLAQFSGPLIIDEVQHVPGLMSYIQVSVDENPTPGRFILTGSHNFLLMSRVSQTLAGRCGILSNGRRQPLRVRIQIRGCTRPKPLHAHCHSRPES